MSAPNSLVPPPPAHVGARLVWGGRWANVVEGSQDGLRCDRFALRRLVDEASEVVVLDALSFPWELLDLDGLSVPLSIALPPELEAAKIDRLLAPVLATLTPVDTLMTHQADVQDTLGRRWGFPSEMWIELPAPGGLREACAVLEERSHAGIRVVESDIGIFETQEDDLITRQLEEFGAHQRGTLAAVLSTIHTGDVVLDVGAHIGTFAVPMARQVGPSGQVVCVEGLAESANLLRRNLERNQVQDRVELVQAIAGTGDDAASPRPRFGNTGATSFAVAAWGESGGHRSLALDDLVEALPRLSDLALLKVDVEGAELDVLHGAAGLIERARPRLLLEVSAAQLRTRGASISELDRWLRSRDYEFFLVAGERNARDPQWRLDPIDTLTSVGAELFDVLATPRTESDEAAGRSGE